MFTVKAVAEYLHIDEHDPAYATIEPVYRAIRALVRRWLGKDPEQWDDDQQYGAMMLTARVHRRRNSPGGVESFNELGPMYVSNRDPDIAMLLGLNQWQEPRIG